MLCFREPQAAPYEYGLANTYLRADGGVVGCFVLASNEPITPFDRDIAQIALDGLNVVQARLPEAARQEAARSMADALLANLLRGDHLTRNAEALSASVVPCFAPPFRLALVCPQASDAHYLLTKELQRAFPRGVVTSLDEDVVLLAWGDDATAELTKRCDALARTAPARIGVSNCFHDLESCVYVLGQARFALPEQVGAAEFGPSASAYLLGDAGLAGKLLARHPAVVELEHEGGTRAAESLETLRAYLRHERSVKRAAFALGIHKNTVLYRIERLRVRFDLDFEDPGERLYLLLSLHVGMRAQDYRENISAAR